MIKKAKILDKADEITKQTNIVIPLYNRNCFISIIPENNRYRHNTIEIQLENTNGHDAIIDTVSVLIPRYGENKFLKVSHGKRHVFPGSTTYNAITESLQNELNICNTRFKDAIHELEHLFAMSTAKITNDIRMRTAAIRSTDKYIEVKDQSSFVLNTNDYKCFIAVSTDYLDDVADIAVQLETINGTVLDKLWIIIPQEPSDFLAIEHDENQIIPFSTEAIEAYNEQQKRLKMRKNDISKIMKDIELSMY